jgi:hypothetical protein
MALLGFMIMFQFKNTFLGFNIVLHNWRDKNGMRRQDLQGSVGHYSEFNLFISDKMLLKCTKAREVCRSRIFPLSQDAHTGIN